VRLRPNAHRENLCVKTIVADVHPVTGARVGVWRSFGEFDMPSRERHEHPVAVYGVERLSQLIASDQILQVVTD